MGSDTGERYFPAYERNTLLFFFLICSRCRRWQPFLTAQRRFLNHVCETLFKSLPLVPQHSWRGCFTWEEQQGGDVFSPLTPPELRQRHIHQRGPPCIKMSPRPPAPHHRPPALVNPPPRNYQRELVTKCREHATQQLTGRPAHY